MTFLEEYVLTGREKLRQIEEKTALGGSGGMFSRKNVEILHSAMAILVFGTNFVQTSFPSFGVLHQI